MVGLQRQQAVEVGSEERAALAGDAVDEVEREVVDARRAQRRHGRAHALRHGAPLQHRQQAGVEALGTQRDAAAARRQHPGERGVDGSGLTSTVRSTDAVGRASSRRPSSAGPSSDGVPPPR